MGSCGPRSSSSRRRSGPTQLRPALEQLAAKIWTHPTTGEPIEFGVSTLERWYYAAKRAPDPVKVLHRKTRSDAGEHPSMSTKLREVEQAQHTEHPQWTSKLHHDNIEALGRVDGSLRPVPSYASVCRYMKACGLVRKRPPTSHATPGAAAAAKRPESRCSA